MIKALLVGVFVSVATSLLGVILVLKRYSMIGDGLSHVGFSTFTIALVCNWVPFFLSIPVVVLSSVFLLWLSENSKIKGDAAIALISTSFLSIGIVAVSLTTGINTSVLSYMFGSVLAINNFDLVISIICSSVVVLVFLFFYNKLFAVSFDENFAKVVGLKTKLYGVLIAVLIGVMIVIGMKIMGALLISSLIVFPALSAMRVFRSFRLVVAESVIISVFCFVCGLIFSYFFALPTGATVVLVNLLVFSIHCLTGRFKKI